MYRCVCRIIALYNSRKTVLYRYPYTLPLVLSNVLYWYSTAGSGGTQQTTPNKHRVVCSRQQTAGLYRFLEQILWTIRLHWAQCIIQHLSMHVTRAGQCIDNNTTKNHTNTHNHSHTHTRFPPNFISWQPEFISSDIQCAFQKPTSTRQLVFGAHTVPRGKAILLPQTLCNTSTCSRY